MKAFRVYWDSMPDQVGIYIADSYGQAKNKCLRQIEEAGYKAKWTQLHCSRAPEYDEWAAKQTPYRIQHGVVEEQAKEELSA